jgi:signal transduction histidine kinase/ligand-binding sensor domain-containing protein
MTKLSARAPNRRVVWSSGVLLFLGTVGIAVPLASQTHGLADPNVVIERISTEHELSNNSVWAITQDERGFIWIGTSDGLNRYDGQRCVVYHSSSDSTGLSNDQIWCLYPDKDGTLWVGTSMGLNRFDPATRSFTRYFPDPKSSAIWSNNMVRSIYRDGRGVLWVGTANGLYKYQEGTRSWTRFLPSESGLTRPGENFVNAIIESNEGAFWVGTGGFRTRGGGLLKFDPALGTFSRIMIDSSDLSTSSERWITSLHEEASGDLWISYDIQGVFTRDARSHAISRLSLPYYSRWSLPSSEGSRQHPTPHLVKRVCEDQTGALWIATYGSGLFRYDKRSREFAQFVGDPSDPRSLSSSLINTMFLDRAGLLWVGTDDGGVNTVSTKRFMFRQILGDSLLIKNRVEAVFGDSQGGVWFGAVGFGAWRVDPVTRRSAHVLSDSVVSDFCADRKGNVWILGLSSLVMYDSQRGSCRLEWKIPSSPLDERGNRIFVDSKGFTWIGTTRGVYLLDRDRRGFTHFVHSRQDSQSIADGWVEEFHEDKSGTIWVATPCGLSRFRRESQSFEVFSHNERDSLSLSNAYCTGILEDESGSLWISTRDGLNRFDSASSTFTRFLAGRNIERMLNDRRQRFWFVTEGTIGMFDPSIGSFRIFDASDGIPSVRLWAWSRALLKSGDLVFGAGTGVLAFCPDSVKPLSYVPPVFVTGIKLFNKQIDLNTSPELLREVAFGYDDNVFSIKYAALSYDMLRHNEYAYKLDGFDKDWIYCGNRQEATYTNLNPGVYTFRVRGSNHDGVWNEAGTSLTIVIRPAYWQTWWFQLMVLLGIVGSAFMFYRHEVMRLQQEKRLQQDFSRQQITFQEAERKRIAGELHDGLGQDLLLAANEIQEALKEKGKSQKRMEEIANLIHGSVNSAREIASNLHPHQLDRLGLNVAIGALVRTLAKSSNVAIDNVSDKVDGILPRQSELHLFRILQEALSNAVRHAGAKHIRIEVKNSNGQITALICDDGRGFDPAEFTGREPNGTLTDVARGFGLANMAERAKIIGGTLKIDSAPNSGTTITVTIPHG